ncbi:MAG: AAA family ATPase [Bacteroides sp.]|nr:AAA family ATPase [Bacteroides sp.]
MINARIEEQIKFFFPYEPTLEQEKVIKALSEFVSNYNNSEAFIMQGYAGTGKTSIVSSLVKALKHTGAKTVLLAPTGRAAKVFSSYSNSKAHTIHKHIYWQKTGADLSANYTLKENLHTNTLFIIDESSMISSQYGANGFGSGVLLDDLMQYIYNDKGCKALFVGDTAQLAPIGEDYTAALSSDVIGSYGVDVIQMEMKKVLRQSEQSGILWNATQIRIKINDEDYINLPKIKISGFADIKVIGSADIIDEIGNSYSKVGKEDTIIICRSNKRANIFNKGVRAQVLWCEGELENGDMIMIAKNNYMWTEEIAEIDFIANGESAIVRRVRKTRELYDFRFADVTLSFPNLEDIEIDVTILLDTLNNDSPALPQHEQERLYNNVMEDYEDIKNKAERIKQLKTNQYYNALQVKYAYAITCHKSQGGQWKHVFIDQAYMSKEYITPDFPKWLYTAFTRATDTLYLMNYPEEFTY